MNYTFITCSKCGEDMPEIRLTKYGYKFCVKCSSIDPYRAVSTIGGENEDTWNDIQITDEKTYKKYQILKEKSNKMLNKCQNEEI